MKIFCITFPRNQNTGNEMLKKNNVATQHDLKFPYHVDKLNRSSIPMIKKYRPTVKNHNHNLYP